MPGHKMPPLWLLAAPLAWGVEVDMGAFSGQDDALNGVVRFNSLPHA